MTDYKAARDNMIESQLRPNAVTNKELLKAMFRTSRELFVPHSQRDLAYIDAPLQVEWAGNGRAARFLLAPMVLAKLVQLAEIRQTDKVLDVGAATGYSSAILAQLAAQVIALESDAGLAALARDAFTAEGIRNVEVVVGSLSEGCPQHAPYDVIFVNGRLGCDPEQLLQQLVEGGRLVAVMGTGAAPKAYVLTKIDASIQKITGFDASAPLLPGFEPKEAFAF